MTGLTIRRALEIQNHLFRAYIGKHGYGGDVAEIYVSLALDLDRCVDAYVKSGAAAREEPSMFRADYLEWYTQAFRDFREIFLAFEREFSCQVSFRLDQHEGPWSPASTLEGIPSHHRFYVKVYPLPEA